MRKHYKLVLFDLDGVLIDSKKNMEISWSAVRATFGIDMHFDSYFELIGRPFTDIMNILGLEDNAEKIKQVYNIASSCRIDLVNIHWDCVNIIRECRKIGVRVGLATSKDRERTLEIVKKMDVLFDVIDCPEVGQRGKPNPDPLFRAMLQCHCEPAETVYIGDMKVDYDCTQRAGIDYMHVEWGYGECDGAQYKLETPNDLKILLR